MEDGREKVVLGEEGFSALLDFWMRFALPGNPPREFEVESGWGCSFGKSWLEAVVSIPVPKEMGFLFKDFRIEMTGSVAQDRFWIGWKLIRHNGGWDHAKVGSLSRTDSGRWDIEGPFEAK